jgi:hypothetical protein
MGLILILILFTGPIVHIVLSAMRINGKIKMSLGVIALIVLGLDIALPALVSYITLANITFKPGEPRCITGVAAVFLGGSILNIIASIVIGLIGSLAYVSKYGSFTNKPGTGL